MASGMTLGDAGAIAWRIFGGGESPKTKMSSYELIDRVIQKHVSSDKQAFVAATVRGWFAESGGSRWLRNEAKPTIATLVLGGIEAPFTEQAVWAVAAIEADVMQRAIETRWTNSQTVSLMDALYETLADVSRRDQIMDPSQIRGLTQQEAGSARVPRDAIERESPLWTFHHLEQWQMHLVIRGLYPAVGRLVDLAVALEGGSARRVFERLEHPVLQARALFVMTESRAQGGDTRWLDWIARDASDRMIAAAIFHILRAVARQGAEDRREEHPESYDSGRPTNSAEACEEGDDTGESLIEGLVNRLAELEPRVCVRWIGETLSYSSQRLGGHARSDKPDVLRELEQRCLECVSGLLVDSPSRELLREFQGGLRRRAHRTWTGFQARAAWLMRGSAGEQASAIARDALAHYEEHVDGPDDGGPVVGDWFDWRDRDWLEALGCAVALSSEDLSYEEWVSDHCRRLPLTVWDAEEAFSKFLRAEPLAQQWFLLAFLAIEPSRELGRPVPPEEVRELAEALWRHARFASAHLGGGPELSVAVELAARNAIEFGAVDDGWALEQAKADRAGARGLWALVDQRRIRNCRTGETSNNNDRILEAELTKLALPRFESGRGSNLLTLQFWGRLWLVLHAAEQAEQTAMAIMSFPDRIRNRGCAILVLRLLGLVVRNRELNREMGHQVAPLYNQLWPAYGSTAPDEKDDRREIEKAFADSSLLRR